MALSQHKWQRKPDERPAQIVDAALEVFSRRGFRTATMDEVAVRAGITKGTIYNYFRSKEDLFIAMVRAKVQEAVDLLPEMSIKPFEDPEALTRRLGMAFMEVLTRPGVVKVIPLVLAEFQHLPKLQAVYWEELLPQANLGLAQTLELGMHLGIVKRLDPVIAARCLFGMFIVFVLTQEVLGAKQVTPMDPGAMVDTIVSIFFRGVLTENGREGVRLTD